jgi:hypothetical protein
LVDMAGNICQALRDGLELDGESHAVWRLEVWRLGLESLRWTRLPAGPLRYCSPRHRHVF